MGLFDFLKVGEFKKKVESLEESNLRLEEDLSKFKELRLSMEEMTLIQLQEEINKRTHEKKSLVLSIKNLNDQIDEKQKDLDFFQVKVEEAEHKLESATLDLEMESFGLYRPKYDFATSLGYKDKLQEIRQLQKELIKEKVAVNYNPNWTVDGSKAKGRKLTNDNIKIILRAFNNECEAAINKVKYNNVHAIQKRIENSAIQLNKLQESVGVAIGREYFDLKLQELYLAYEYERKKEDEREELRAQREKEREDKALQKEIADKKKLIDKDINHIINMLSELEEKMLSADEATKESLAKQIEELKDKIEQKEADKAELDYRLMNASAGYVYIISNIGSFGPDMFKIGVTRRLDPQDRIRELSSASVPFKFDVHALIFSYDAYSLESELHKKFEASRVNLVNNRKEFFKVNIEDIKKELIDHSDLTIDFSEKADAEEYRESSKILIKQA